MKNSCVLDVVARLRSHLFDVCVWVCVYSPSGTLSPAGYLLEQHRHF